MQTLTELKNQATTLSEKEFDEGCEEVFTTRLSNGEEVELCEGGKQKKVTKENIQEFIDLILEARINENKAQMIAIKEGVELIIDVTKLAMLTWEEIETRATGEKVIDVNVLKKVTNYNVSDTNEYVQRFWRVFEAFSEEDKRAYLKYVWGRSRMPADTSSMQRHRLTIYPCSPTPRCPAPTPASSSSTCPNTRRTRSAPRRSSPPFSSVEKLMMMETTELVETTALRTTSEHLFFKHLLPLFNY